MKPAGRAFVRGLFARIAPREKPCRPTSPKCPSRNTNACLSSVVGNMCKHATRTGGGEQR